MNAEDLPKKQQCLAQRFRFFVATVESTDGNIVEYRSHTNGIICGESFHGFGESICECVIMRLDCLGGVSASEKVESPNIAKDSVLARSFTT